MGDLLKSGENFRGYVVQRRIGSGSAAAVYLVRHEVLDAFYALKVLDPSLALGGDPEFVQRFLREARLATRIRHPNLVAVHDCGLDAATGLYYLVMDYVPGSSLRTALAFEGRMPAKQAASIIAQVASALDAAQAFQVVHRDIKPENIMLQPDGCVKLVDLGIAKARNLGDTLSTNTDSVFGTPSYISPEQAQCATDVDARADIYSLGMVFFEMLTGRCPYDGDNPAQILVQILSDDPVPDMREFVPGMSPDLSILVRRMTVKDRTRRISSFKTVLEELDRLGLGNVVKPPAESVCVPRPVKSMGTLLGEIGKASKEARGSDSQAPLDDEMREFLARRELDLEKKASRRKAMFYGAVAAFALIVLLVAVLILVSTSAT